MLLSCSPGKEKSVKRDSTTVDNNRERVVQSQYPDGKKKSEIVFKDGKKNGLAKTFDQQGSLILELPYVNDSREGMSKRYYKNGTVAQTTEYKNNMMTGIQTKYRPNGNLMSEARFENDFPCAGLREYLENKSLKKKYPSIEIKVQDNLSTTGIYKLKLSLTEKVRTVKFYQGKLTASGCMHDNVKYLLLDEATKTGEIAWQLGPREFVMEELNIIAVYETLLGNTAIAQRKYHVAIDAK